MGFEEERPARCESRTAPSRAYWGSPPICGIGGGRPGLAGLRCDPLKALTSPEEAPRATARYPFLGILRRSAQQLLGWNGVDGAHCSARPSRLTWRQARAHGTRGYRPGRLPSASANCGHTLPLGWGCGEEKAAADLG